VKIDSTGNFLLDARQLASPNCDERPPGAQIGLVVVHGISLPPGEYGGPWIEQLFTNRLDPAAHPYFAEIAHLRVSSHLLIRRDGELVQFVPFHRRAWHAGQSSYRGRTACNDFSIGVELEGQDDEPYAPVQYARLAQVIQVLMSRHPGLGVENITGHCDISPGRKTDPGPAFDWLALRQQLEDSGHG
jgi:N-acetyl-anhydromuramoyl-L-alanine amidase